MGSFHWRMQKEKIFLIIAWNFHNLVKLDVNWTASEFKEVMWEGHGWKVLQRLEKVTGQDQDQDSYQMRLKSSGRLPWRERNQRQSLPEVAFGAWNFEALFDSADVTCCGASASCWDSRATCRANHQLTWLFYLDKLVPLLRKILCKEVMGLTS